jgi:hypothetical protein
MGPYHGVFGGLVVCGYLRLFGSYLRIFAVIWYCFSLDRGFTPVFLPSAEISSSGHYLLDTMQYMYYIVCINADNQTRDQKMNTFKSIDEARTYAAGKPQVSHIVEIEPGMPGINQYVCATVNAKVLRAGLKNKPMAEVKTVVGDVVNLAVERQAIRQAEEMAVFQAARAAGTAFRVVEIADQYGADLQWARRLTETEQAKYSDWFRKVGMIGFACGPALKVEVQAVLKVVAGRRPDGAFLGCTNRAWTITEKEWIQIKELTAQIVAGKAAKKEVNRQLADQDIQHKIDTGYCFNCESYCFGDCGNYQKDPMFKAARDFQGAVGEMYYGIKD